MTGVPGRREPDGPAPEGRALPTDDGLEVAVRALVLWRGAKRGVTIVAIDGYGASGKSTIAESLCSKTGARLIRTDDFFMPDRQRSRAPRRGEPTSVTVAPAGETGRGIGTFYDVTRLRAEGLEPLRAGRAAVFHAFDWDKGAVSRGQTRVEPNDLVLLEGVYSGAPELGDLVDRAIFVDTPEPERLHRLRGRVAPEDWDEEWLRAEKEYFACTRPLESFDLAIRGTGAPAPALQGARTSGGGRRAGRLRPGRS
ncbi:MAG: uridine kinase [Acidimicrobiales bacterium]